MPRRIFHIFLAAAFLSFTASVLPLQGQGTFGPPIVLNTTAGQALISQSISFSSESSILNPVLRMKVGFATDELAGPGAFLDSFTITLQDDSLAATLVLLTMDASGTLFAPLTPGGLPVDESSISRTIIAYPSLMPLLAQQSAFAIEMALPESMIGRPVTAYFDLFNNQNSLASQAFFHDFQVVPEPSALWLLVAGGGLFVGWRRLVTWMRRSFTPDLSGGVGRQGAVGDSIPVSRPGHVRSLVLLALLLCLSGFAPLSAVAQSEQEFRLNNVDLTLAEATPDVAVYFTSMRLNRALNVWNVEVSVTNTSQRVLAGPLVLMIDSFSGTTGVQQPDGITAGDKSFLDLSALAQGASLSPGQGTAKRTLTLGRSGNGSPSLATKFYVARPPVAAALAITRSLNEAGQPLPGVSLNIAGPTGSSSQQSDAPSGVASFGQGPGEHVVKFSADGYLPVWRRQQLNTSQTTVLPNPRLTRRSAGVFNVTPLGGTIVTNIAGTITIEIGAGVVSQTAEVRLTTLSGQNLPAFLPLGWSPLNSFWLESSSPLSGTVIASLRPAGAIGTGETAALVKWDETTLQWRVSQTLAGSGTNPVTVQLTGAGAYALVAPDPGDTAPPAAQVGTALQGFVPSASIDGSGLTAQGSVTPPASPASLTPELVTGTANLLVRHATSKLPSGYLLRGEVTETYLLRDGSLRLTPQYEHFIVGYQRPGDQDPNTLQAKFPMRPVLLFGTDQLEEATVRVDVLPQGPFDGEVLDARGGQVGGDGVRVLAGNGRLNGPSALRLRRLDGSVFTNLMVLDHAVIGAFDLTVDRSTVTAPLAAQLSGAPTNGLFVLARVLSGPGFYGLEPVERLQSDGNGNLLSLEPTTGERLPGLVGSGQYVLVRVFEPQGLILGVARNGSGAVQSGMPVRLTGLPWLTLTDDAGRYRLVAPAGEVEVGVTDPSTGDTGFATVTMPDPDVPLEQDLGTAPAGPRVAGISPTNGATRVPRVGSVVIRFNEAVNPGTVVGGAIQLLKPDDSVVSAALSLNLAGTVVTLSPANELEANTTYRVVLSGTIADPGGLPLEGQSEFTFTTVPLSTRVATAQLVIYEPGATNVPVAITDDIPAFTPGEDPFAIVVHGQPGVADPEVPVVLVNESTGETQTVLSKLDGSFSSFITGTEEDFVSATFVNLNGTRVYVPVSRQEFDNGFVGLYPQGGILEAESDGGPVQVFIEPSAIPTRSKFKLEPLTSAALMAQLQGVLPAEGSVAGPALNLRIEGPAPTLPMQVRFPVNLTNLGYPTNEAPTDAAAAVAVVRENEGVTTFEVMDQLKFTPAPFSEPAPSLQGKPRLNDGTGDNQQLAAGFLDTSIGIVMPALGRSALPIQVGWNQVIVPLLFGARPVTVKGKVAAFPYDLAVGLQLAGLINQVLNAQTGNERIDVPFQIAQSMGLVNNPLERAGGLAQQAIGIGVFAFQQQQIRISQPLPGAFVTLTLSGGPLNAQRGRIFPGMVYATSGQDGYFLTVAPAVGANYLVTASHPLYRSETQAVNPISTIPGQQGDLSLAGVVFKNFFFFEPSISETPPTVNISTIPAQPAPGQPCQIIVNASQPAGAPEIGVGVVSVGTKNLLTGLEEQNVTHSLGNIVETKTGTSARWEGTLLVNKPVLVRLKVVVQGQNDFQSAVIPYAIGFTGVIPPNLPVNIPPPDTNDVHGPLVVEARPADYGFVDVRGEIEVHFNKPIDGAVTNQLDGILLSGGPGSPRPVVKLAPNQRSVTIGYPGLVPDQAYELTLTGQSVRDLAGRPLDQYPSTTNAESYTLNFRTPPAASTTLPGLVNGKGTMVNGDRLYALEQGNQGNSLAVYDVGIPLQPKLIGRTPLRGQPRDLVVVPRFAYKRNVHAPVETNDVVVVVGGDLDARIDLDGGAGANPQNSLPTVSVQGQYLWAVAMEKRGEEPRILASPIVSYRVASAVPKVIWEPPFVVYQEYGADIQLLGFVNLQEMIIGFSSNQSQRDAFPTEARRNENNRGKDLNGDGDYVDEGETLPIPDFAPNEFYGKHNNFVLQNTTQKILDFSVLRAGAEVGVTLGRGRMLDAQGRPNGSILHPMYRTLVSGGLPLDIPTPLSAAQLFPDAYPRWVTLIKVLPITLDGVRTTISAALVSLQPDMDSTQKLAVVDITQPLAPRVVNKIPIPEDLLGGSIQSVTLGRNGSLEVAGSRNLLFLNPLQLGVTEVPPGQLHPAILGLLPQAGAGSRSIGSTDFGVHSVAEGSRAYVVQAPPDLVFVRAPNASELLIPAELRGRSEASVNAILSDLEPTGGLAPARVRREPNVFVESDLEPNPNLSLHYYVLVRAPGGAGRLIELGLESLNPSGRPLSNPGQGFAPVRAVTDETQAAIGQIPRPNCGAPIRSLPAWRLSDDPTSPLYNRYLSRPFALVTETVSSDELFRFTTLVDREILFSGAALRAFIEPGQATADVASPVVGPFAARIDARRNLIFPISSVTAYTVNRDYLVGDNPPPTGGTSPIEDTYGTILSHSGELRTADVDITIPSPRMPVAITRVIGNQDTYEGPFGVGWDFNYNQRLTVLDPLTFPAGLQMPLVVRDEADNSEVAGSQDVLFNDGQGRVFHFIWKGTNMPPEFAADPLVQEFDYEGRASDYYLPQRGLFNLLVKFKDGRFERLTPSGMRYRYSASGRLETVLDTFPLNRHELQYDRNGWLVRIDDRSVRAPRFVEIGHYRRSGSDPDFVPGLDEDTNNSYLEGLICRLRDYTGRDVLFEYDSNGFLIKRLDVEVSGNNGGFAGRAETHYEYVNCRLATIKAAANGTPYVSAANATSSSGKPVAQATSGNYGNGSIDIEVENSAKTVGNQSSGVTLGDQSRIQRTFDNRGHLTSTTVSGGGGPAVTEVRSNTVDGLLYYVRHPEGNTETRVYDSGNPVFRSRANLKSVTFDPGSRGGPGYAMTYNYDARYNLQSGQQINANGFPINIRLSADGRAPEVTDYGDGFRQTVDYNDRGQIIRTVDERGVEHTVAHDASTGFMRSRTVGGITYEMGYDSSIAGKLGRPTTISQPLGAPTRFVYDERTLPVQITRGELRVKRAYDELGREIFREDELGAGRRLTVDRVYDSEGFLRSETLGGVEIEGAIGTLTTRYTADKRSRVETATLPDGTVQTYGYDARGNVKVMTIGELAVESEFDLNNNLIEQKRGGDVVATFAYDGLDRMISHVRKSGAADYAQMRTYHPGGEVKTQMLSDPVYGILENQQFDDLDALGRFGSSTRIGSLVSPRYEFTHGVLASQVSGPRMTKSMTWDKAGNTISYADPNVQTTLRRDDNGRVFEIESQEEGATYKQIFTFNELDQQESLSDLLGLQFGYEPRADGKVIKVTNARDNETTIDHTALGEVERVRRADGMEVKYQHDGQRQTTYQGDPEAGFEFNYDNSLRLTSKTQRNGGELVFEDFDTRNMPQTITLPGGTETRKYDLLQRMTERKQTYQGGTIEEQYIYDGMDRVREVAYGAIGAATNLARYSFDPAGPLVGMQYFEGNHQFEVTYGLYADGSRRTINYPSGVVVTEERDATGRLTGVADANGNIIRAISWQGNLQPRTIDLGASMAMVCQYDARGRVTATRAIRKSDGKVLAHFRFQYDAANNLEIRQWLHRGGRADVFEYDEGERVAHARLGVLLTNVAGFGPVQYERQYTYDQNNKDLLTVASLSGPGPVIPPFAGAWSGHDSFLQPAVVGGFTRGLPDPKGNVTAAQLWARPDGGAGAMPVAATLQHDGLNRLIRLVRADGVTVENSFQPGGLRFDRRVTDNGSTTERRAYVYDDSGRLLEEYDRTATPPVLLGRYYYATADGPVAADLRDAGGTLRRYYYLTDPSLSVVAVVDAAGEVVERVWYDTFGQPAIEQRDTRAPVVKQVMTGNDGALLVAMSEPVQSAWRDPGVGTGIVVFTNSIPGALSLHQQATGDPIQGNTVLLSEVPGFAPSSVLQYTPGASASGIVTLTLNGGGVSDEWGNTNAPRTITVTNSAAPGTVLYRATVQEDTAPVRLARSSVGSSFLFHGQYFDYATGLLYLRARYYDPYSGMFLEPDPLGYADSVNHYAGMANNPVSLRDPTGLDTHYRNVPHGQVKILRDHGYSHAELSLYSQARPTLKKLGMGDMEIAAHVRVMYREHMEGMSWELGIRSFDEKAPVRRENFEKGYQTKIEEIEAKTDAESLVNHKGKDYVSDMDGLYAKVNGQIATIDMLQRFQSEVNAEVASMQSAWHDMARAEGRTVVSTEIQKVYQHGFSLNIPQEVGTRHDLSPGESFGYYAIDKINQKMRKGIGNAFSFSMHSDGMKVNPSVDVDSLVREHADYYQNVMFNPHEKGRGFNERIYNRRIEQIRRDGKVEEALFPWPFYTPNKR